MTNSAVIQSAPPLPEAAEAVPKSGAEYSIRYFVEWHQQLFETVVNWCADNCSALLAAAVSLAVTGFVCFAFRLLLRKVVIPIFAKKNKNIALEIKAVASPVAWLIFWLGFSFSVGFVPIREEAQIILDRIFYVCFILAILSIFFHALKCTSSLMIESFKRRDPANFSMNKLLLDLSLSIIRLAVAIFAIIFVLQEVFHLNVAHLITSAGILGLAVAFAAKDTIANIFGAFSILGSKMFQVGDCIKTGSAEGVVEQIGVRSIRIRAFSDGRIIDIPNHIIADAQIENFSKRLFWREHFSFGLVYQTTPEQIALAKKLLNEIGQDLADLLVEGKPVQFDFLLFDQSSLNIEGYVWFKGIDMLTMRKARGIFNEEVLKRFNAAGLEIAYPTTTVVMEPSDKK